MVCSETSMPLASDVPRSGPSRSIAATTSDGSLVGTWTEKPLSLKATTPMRTELGWRSTNVRAAAFAASIRVGARSVAAMLPETSKARITVPSIRGTPITLCGRASDATRIVRPATTSTAGSRRRIPRRSAGRAGRGRGARAAAARHLAAAPKTPNAAMRARRRRSRTRYSATPTGIVRRSSSIAGQMNDIGYARRRFRSAAIRTIAPTRSSSVDIETASTPARLNASRNVVSRRSAASRNRFRKPLSWVST